MKEYSGKLKKFIKPLIIIVLLLTPLILIQQLSAKDTYKDAYRSWAAGKRYSHISVFFSKEAEFSPENVMRLRSEIEADLRQDDVLESKNGTVSWVDCYSARGSVSVHTDATPMEFTAYGVGGDFFKMHPFRLVSGSFFSDENLMNDLIVIDEDLAWQLFGSADIIGMTVYINNMPFQICGVIKRESGIFNSAAGNHKTVVYMSYSALEKSSPIEITNYEVIMPNLTKGYAYKIVKKHLADVEDASEISVISGRFSYGNLLREIKKIGNNVMRKKAIVYPFWENKQRAILQVCAVIFLIFLVEAVLVVIAVIGKGSLFYVRNRELLAEKWAHTKDMLMDVGRRTKGKLMKRKIDTVILDIGMVLAEFIPREYLKKVGIREEKIKAVMDAVVENDIWNEYDKGMMSEKEVLNQFIERSPKLEREIRRAFKNLNGIVRRYYYTDGFIEKLKSKGYRVLYLSNISEKLYHECEEELGFIKKMDGGILSFEVKMKKPDKDIYELLIKKYSLNPERCVFLDDREVNLRAAGELGFKTILFEDYESAKQSLKL